MVVWSPIFLIIGAAIFFKCMLKRVNAGKSIALPIVLLLIVGALIFVRSATHVSVMQPPSQVQVAPVNTSTVDDFKSPQEKLAAAIQNFVNAMVAQETYKFTHSLISKTSTDVMQAESTLCATTADADNEARGAAANLLFPYVKAGIEPRIAGSPLVKVVANDDWLKKEIKSSLERGVGVVNKHVDRIERPYGVLWKETLQVDTSAGGIQNNFAGPFQQLAEAQATGKQSEWLTLAGLAGVIFLLYLFLNSATKGYFVWRLRAVAMLVAIAAVLTIFAIA